MRAFLFLLSAFSVLVAQPPVAPTPSAVGKPRGQDVDGYNVVQSFETGYRFVTVGGNGEKYRSDVNFGNGVRLLSGQLTVHSKKGQGRWFDEIVLTTQGLGNDPYQSSLFRIQKNKLYRYDMLWRLDEYVNPALAISNGQHAFDTTRNLQDHDFTLLPQSRFQFKVGYSRDIQDGPALTTVNLFDGSRGDEFPLFANIKRQFNEFRVGNDIDLFGFKLSWLHAWHNFKEDSTSALAGSSPGANTADQTSLNAFRRTEPYHGNSPLWRVNLRTDRKAWAANARFTNVAGSRGFVLDENAVGVNRLGAAANRQILVGGDARRPVTTGDFSVSVFPGSRLTLVNNTSYYQARIDGNSFYSQFDNGAGVGNILFFRFLGMRTFTNSTDASYRIAPWLSITSGYHYATRRIRSIEQFSFVDFAGQPVAAEQENRVDSGSFGFRLKPLKPLTIAFDGEIARSDRPFTPISDKNFHSLGGRVQYKTRSLLVSGSYREHYNTNSISVTAHSARSRTFSGDVSWMHKDRFGFDASYAKLHLDTVSGIAFFGGGRLQQGFRSIYISNIHSANLGVRATLRKFLDLYAGYSINRDTGDGRAAAVRPENATLPTSFLDAAQTFPMRYESPLARVSVRLRQKLRWNFGWQYYRYVENFGAPLSSVLQDYRAHTGYSSLLWSF